VGAWIIEARPTAELSKNIMMARSHSPQYCLFSKDKEEVEVLFEIDPWRLDNIEEFREDKECSGSDVAYTALQKSFCKDGYLNVVGIISVEAAPSLGRGRTLSPSTPF